STRSLPPFPSTTLFRSPVLSHQFLISGSRRPSRYREGHSHIVPAQRQHRSRGNRLHARQRLNPPGELLVKGRHDLRIQTLPGVRSEEHTSERQSLTNIG